MTDHKFTDDEVIKALELCFTPKGTSYTCAKCPFRKIKRCKIERDRAALDLLHRQKAEIERLKSENKLLTENDVRNKYPNCVSVEKGRIYTRTLEDYDELIGDISAEAIKEFAERLKEKIFKPCYFVKQIALIWEDIDTLVKEMTEEAEL